VGTAAVVAGGVQHHQEQKWGAQEAEQQAEADAQAVASQQQLDMARMQGQMEAMQAQQAQAAMPAPAAPVAAPAAPAAPDVTAQLQQLAQMKQAGVLSDEEFAAAKAKLLAG
jgi:hypothetical protein